MARKKIISDEKLLQTAREIFLTHGIDVSVQKIADTVGISQPAIFKRYGSKQNLIVAALAPDIYPPDIEPLLQAPANEHDFREQLRAILVHLGDFISRIYLQFRLLQDSKVPCKDMSFPLDNDPLLRLEEGLITYLRKAKHNELIVQTIDEESMAHLILGSLFTRQVIHNRRTMQRRNCIDASLIDDLVAIISP